MNLFARIAATAVAVGVAVWLVQGIHLTAEGLLSQGVTLVTISLIIGAVNLIVKPLVKALTGCLVAVTLGLFMFVINAAMLMLTSWIADQFDIGFHVDGFVAALIGSIIISFVSSIVYMVLGDDD